MYIRKFFLFFIFPTFFFSACQDSSESSTPTATEVQEETVSEERQGDPYAILETSKGEITIRLRPDLAPETVRSFLELAEVGFYNRTTFHRVMKGRMIQGGDPYSRDRDPYNDGQGTSGEYLPIEFSEEPFDRGTVAMGRTPGSDKGGSCQFFIVLQRSPDWDGQYNVFGEIVGGIEVAEEISNSPLSKDSHPAMKNRPVGKQVIEGIQIEYR